jgi:Mn-dependent DtxR family transcriptional regulator
MRCPHCGKEIFPGQEQRIVKMLEANKYMSNIEIAGLLGISPKNSSNLLRKLRGKGIIHRAIHNGKYVLYTLTKE